jgi:hypothetical protein
VDVRNGWEADISKLHLPIVNECVLSGGSMRKRHAFSILALLAVQISGVAVTAPILDKPGFVIEYHRPPPTFGGPSVETWTKRGDLVRVDRIANREGGGPAMRVASYHRLGQPSVFSIGRFPDGSLATLHVMRDPLSHPPPLAERTFSGASEKHLGESCRRWQRSVAQPSGPAFEQSGCVTDDGVELWWRNANVHAIFAKAITETPVRSHDVEAPLDLLDFRKWMEGVPPGSHEGDYEVMLSSINSPTPTKVVRRSGNWLLQHEKRSSSETLTVTNSRAGITLRYNKGVGDHAQLSITRKVFGHSPRGGTSLRERMAGQDTMILGERCQWRNMTKGVADLSIGECLTKDGVSLAVTRMSHGAVWAMKATKLNRGRIPIESILPPAEIVSPATWGLAQHR